MLSVLAGNASAHAGQWEFQGFTIAESTPVFERTALSTAGRSNTNNEDLKIPGRPALRLSTAHNTLLFMRTNVLPQVVVALEPCAQGDLDSILRRFTFTVSHGGTKHRSSIRH
jgi:hypothetical protein